LWKIAAPGSEPVQLTQDDRYPSGTFGLAQMPDESLIYTRVDAKESEIWLARPDGREARLIAGGPGSNVAPNLAPDGRSIVFSAITPAKTSVIWRMDAASGASRTRLTAESSEYSDYHPQFTPDGSSVIFQRQFVATDRSVLMKVPAAGGEAALFYQDPQRGVFAPRLSPDGRYIAFSTYDVTTFEKKLVIAVLEKGTIARIERELEYNLINQVAWSPDSRSLTILTSRGGIPNLWRQPLDGSEPRPITDFKTGRIFNFAWGTDKKSLLIARGNTTSDLLLIRDTGRETGGDAVTQLRNVRSARGASL
jgi:Tol biopolymer transport system component